MGLARLEAVNTILCYFSLLHYIGQAFRSHVLYSIWSVRLAIDAYLFLIFASVYILGEEWQPTDPDYIECRIWSPSISHHPWYVYLPGELS